MSLFSANNIKYLLKRAPDECFIVFKLSNNCTLFEAFKSAKHFFKYNKTQKFKDRNYYETVLRDTPQKPRFDIDIDRKKYDIDATIVVNDLLFAIMDVSAYYDQEITFNDILLYSSNGLNKYSYHIIVDNWYHNNHREAKRFYELVIEAMDKRYRKYIDNSVYKSLQQFRFLGNTKKGEMRPKTRITEWKYNDADITWELERSEYGEFVKSLLTYTENCKHFELDMATEDSNRRTDSDVVGADKILPLIPDGFKIDFFSKHGYKLKRIHRSHCLICNRSHDHENAYIKIEDGSVIYKCFRDLSERYVLDVIEKETKTVPDREILKKMTEEIMAFRNKSVEKDDPHSGDRVFMKLMEKRLAAL